MSSNLSPKTLVVAGVALVAASLGAYLVVNRVNSSRLSLSHPRRSSAAESTAIVAEEALSVRSVHPLPNPITNEMTATTSAASSSSPSPIVYTAQSVLQLVRESFPLWRDSACIQSLSTDAFLSRRLTGGSSNSLWLLSIHPPVPFELETATPVALVVRFYGAATGAFIQRDTEALVADLLSAAGVGAKIFHHFDPPHKGRIEQFIPGRTLNYDELSKPEIGIPIVQELARLHVIDVPHTKEYECIPRESQLFRNAWKWLLLALEAHQSYEEEVSEVQYPEDIYARRTMRQLYESLKLPQLHLSAETLQRLLSQDLKDSKPLPRELKESYWVKELQWLQELLENWNDKTYGASTSQVSNKKSDEFLASTIAYSQLGLCHNDLNPGNIMYIEPKVEEAIRDNNQPAEVKLAYEAAADEASPHPAEIAANAESSKQQLHEQQDTAATVAAASSSNPSLSSSSPVALVPPVPFTLIDFEYAAFNSPAYDLANHFCEYALDYTVPQWPLFTFKHEQYFMSHAMMRERLEEYMKEKRKMQPSLPPVTSSAVGHLYVSTLTHMLASNLLWSLWSIIQASSAAASSDQYPSWQLQPDGRPFQPSPLAYLEYAEQRMEMYQRMKSIWLNANSPHHDEAEAKSKSNSTSKFEDPYPPPPRWQSKTTDVDWIQWMEQLAPIHQQIRQIQLQSARRQKLAFQMYQQTALTKKN